MLHDPHDLEENLLLMRVAEPLPAFGGSIRTELSASRTML
jgi:hypothetical protein